jgi:tetrahydromethanopterin S-methyltransferase subunit C
LPIQADWCYFPLTIIGLFPILNIDVAEGRAGGLTMEEMCQKVVIARNLALIGLIVPEFLRKNVKSCKKTAEMREKTLHFAISAVFLIVIV